MHGIYTTTELSVHWGCTSKTARKRAVSEGFKTIPKKVDGKTLDAFEVPENRLEELKTEIHQMKQKFSGGIGSIQNHSQGVFDTQQEYTESTLVKENTQFVHSEDVEEGIGKVLGSSQEGSDTMLELARRIEELSREAGKVELLEDLQKREEGNTKFWQDKYMELQQTVAELSGTVAELKTKLNQKETELSELKRPLLKKVFGLK